MSQEDVRMGEEDDDGEDDEERTLQEQFEGEMASTFAPHEKSKQYRVDHPDGDLTKEQAATDSTKWNPHDDGDCIYTDFGLEQLPTFLTRASKMAHPVSQHPEALAHFLTHLKEWEKWELKDYDPWEPEERDFDDPPPPRRKLFEWYLGLDKRGTETLVDPAPDDAIKEQEEAMSTRMKRLRPGGTGIVIHGEQGTTKTTGMYWLVANLMEVNQRENVVWLASLEDTEWQVFGRWATIFLPEGINVEMVANPHAREYRRLSAFETDPGTVAREVIRYDSPEDIVETMAEREPGHFYVVYPDPRLRQCQALTGYSYENIWDVDNSEERTKLNHFWFGFTEALHQSSIYNYWTTLVGDEAHKWLNMGKGNDEHDWWDKIDDWATYWGDARKERLSVILATHGWKEIHNKVRLKVRWGATMNGEKFPDAAPLDGENVYDQDLGDFCVWNKRKWNHVGYPDIKRHFSIPGDIEVDYPGFRAEIDRKS